MLSWWEHHYYSIIFNFLHECNSCRLSDMMWCNHMYALCVSVYIAWLTTHMGVCSYKNSTHIVFVCSQNLDWNFLLLHCNNLMIVDIFAITLLWFQLTKSIKRYSGLTVDREEYFKLTFDFYYNPDEDCSAQHIYMSATSLLWCYSLIWTAVPLLTCVVVCTLLKGKKCINMHTRALSFNNILYI